MKIYKIECEWEMKEAIENEDWLCMVDMTLKQVKKEGYVSIEIIDVL